MYGTDVRQDSLRNRSGIEDAGNALVGSLPVSIPEIPASMQNLEKEVEALIELSQRFTDRVNGILRPDTPRPVNDQKEGLEPTKSPVASHTDQIALRVRRYRQELGNVIDRVAL